MIRRATHFLSDFFLTNCCFGQKIKRLLEDLKKMEQDHQSALVHLEREKILRCERLKAAQVKKNQPKTQFLWSQRTVVKSGLLCRAH